jgi:hypothetical protein
VTAPAWLAATTGYEGLAGQVNQFLATHAITYVYTGAEQSSEMTAGSGGVSSDSLWLAQSFTTASGQTTAGYVQVNADYTGTPASPWVFSIQANSSGAPSGTPLVSTALPKEFLGTSPGTVSVFLPVTGLTASTEYWIVAAPAGDASDYFSWSKSNQSSGASTSSNGTSWTAQSYGLMYAVWDQTVVTPLLGTWEDSGARWVHWSYSSGLVSSIKEYTAGQAANGYTASVRSLTYTDGLLTGVA